MIEPTQSLFILPLLKDPGLELIIPVFIIDYLLQFIDFGQLLVAHIVFEVLKSLPE